MEFWDGGLDQVSRGGSGSSSETGVRVRIRVGFRNRD